jgi:hypothetical protein
MHKREKSRFRENKERERMAGNRSIIPGVSSFPTTVNFGSDWLFAGPGKPGPQGPAYGVGNVFKASGYGIETNTSINETVRLSTEGKVSMDTSEVVDIHQLLFTHIKPETVSHYSQGPGSKSMMYDIPCEGMSLPRMNQWLMSEEGRRAYGGQTDMKKFKEDWQLRGGLVTSPTRDVRNRGEWVVTVTSGKRHRMKNIWLAQAGCTPKRGSVLLLVGTYHALNPELPCARPSDAPASAAMEQKLQSRWDITMTDVTEAPAFYWRLAPVSLPSHMPRPPAEMLDYTVDFTERTAGGGQQKATVSALGEVYEVGVASDLFHSDRSRDWMRQQAQEGVFPTDADPEVFRKKLLNLDDVEIMLRLKC